MCNRVWLCALDLFLNVFCGGNIHHEKGNHTSRDKMAIMYTKTVNENTIGMFEVSMPALAILLSHC